MLDWLLELDRNVFVFLNSLGSESWDGFWLFITRQVNWAPIFLLILYLAFKRLGWKHALLVVGLIALLVLITDQSTNVIKNTFERLRPGSDPTLAKFIRAVQTRNSFSFISGHASSSMASAFFLYHVLKPYLKNMGLIFLWPLIFAYSRIYLGLHYPGDILVGYMFGLLTSSLMLLLYRYLRDKFFPKEKAELDHPTNSEPIT